MRKTKKGKVEDQGTELQHYRRQVSPPVVVPPVEVEEVAQGSIDANDVVLPPNAAPAVISPLPLSPTQNIQNARLVYPGNDFYHLVFNDAVIASECSEHIGRFASNRVVANGVNTAPRIETARAGHTTYAEGTPYLRIHSSAIDAVARVYNLTASLSDLNSTQVAAQQANSQVAP